MQGYICLLAESTSDLFSTHKEVNKSNVELYSVHSSKINQLVNWESCKKIEN
jgi:hypothetical protein